MTFTKLIPMLLLLGCSLITKAGTCPSIENSKNSNGISKNLLVDDLLLCNKNEREIQNIQIENYAYNLGLSSYWDDFTTWAGSFFETTEAAPQQAQAMMMTCGGVVGGIAPGDDFDGDGYCNDVDLDDDNDGILDAVECNASTILNEAGGSYSLDGSLNTISATINNANPYGNGNTIMVGKLWNRDANPAGTSDYLEFTLSFDGIDYVTYQTHEGQTSGTLIPITYLNGASGNLVNVPYAVTGAEALNWEIYLPTNIANNGLFEIFIDMSDKDGNGIGDGVDDIAIENITMIICADTDNDGKPDYQDTDSDNDGCPDALEAAGTYTNSQLTAGAFTGVVDGDGVPTTTTSTGQATTAAVTDALDATVCCDVSVSGFPDNDGDNVADYCDLDDDNDGILDTDEIVANCPRVNLALSSSLSQSSTLATYPVTNLIDNNFGNFSHTEDADLNEWVTIDLGDIHYVENIVVWNRADCCQERLSNAYVLMSSNPFPTSSTDVSGSLTNASFTNQFGLTAGVSDVDILVGEVGRYIHIQKSGTNIGGNALNLAEVQVFGSCDNDNDGIVNQFDNDSDNDGCPDAIEGAGTYVLSDLTNNQITAAVNTDGVPNNGGSQGVGSSLDASTVVCCDAAESGFPDNDGDNITDQCDLDNDNDGILDTDENIICQGYNFTGSDQIITAPANAIGMRVKVWGAGGGHEIVNPSIPAGAGGYTYGEFGSDVVSAGTEFSLVVGEGGNRTTRPNDGSHIGVYGFGGEGTHDQGGGLSGLFIGNTTVLAADQSRALVIAGGGGGMDDDGSGSYAAGTNGNGVNSGGETTMLGSNEASYPNCGASGNFPDNFYSTGGGGYQGGARNNWMVLIGSANGVGCPITEAGGNGGSGFVSPQATVASIEATGDGTSTPPNTTDADYTAGIGVAATNGAGGNGLIVVCWILDTDMDGIADYLDPDSDNDGCPDALEAAGTYTSSQLTAGAFTGGVDGDGVPTTTSAGQATTAAVTDASDATVCCDVSVSGFPDSDGDNVADHCDLDDDNDGILDAVECGVNLIQNGDFATFTGANPSPDFADWTETGEYFEINGGLIVSGDNVDGTLSKIITTSHELGSIAFDFGWNNGGFPTEIPGTQVSVIIRVNGVDYMHLISDPNGAVDDWQSNPQTWDPLIVTYLNGASGILTGNHNGNNTVNPTGYLNWSLTNVVLDLPVLSSPTYNIEIIGLVDTDINGNDITGYDDFFMDNLVVDFCPDTDNDGIADYLDTDSDNDGCPDAIEGGATLTSTNLDGNNMITGAVDANGIPTAVGGAGQAIGTSQDSTLQGAACTTLAQNDINQTPQDVNVSGNLLTNDNDPTGDSQTVQSATALDNAGNPINIPIGGAATTIYDENANEAGTIVINADGSYTFDPQPDFTGDVPVDYVVVDSNGDTAEATLSVEVIPSDDPSQNDAPVANDDTNTTDQDVNVLGNVISPNDYDPEGDVLTVTSALVDTDGDGTVDDPLTVGTPTPIYGISETGDTLLAGTMTLTSTGDYTFDPEPNFVGDVPVDYTITDTAANTDDANLTITVEGEDPTTNSTYANDDSNTGDQGDPQTGNVVTNDNDPEGNSQTVGGGTTSDGTAIVPGTAVTLQSGGKLTLNPDGSYSYIPDANFVGTEVVVYEVCDDGTPSVCEEATLYLTTLAANTTDATCDFNNTPFNTKVFGDVSTNDSDKEGNTQTSFTLDEANGGMNATTDGAVTMNADGTYDFTPVNGFSGETSFSYSVCDDGSPMACDTAVVFIEVLPAISSAGGPIIANVDANTVESGSTVAGNVVANDFDPDDRGFSVSAATAVTAATVSGVDEDGNTVADAGTLTLNTDGTYSFTPTGSFTGVITHNYEICTSSTPGVCDDTVLEITVTADAGNTTFANDDAAITDAGVMVSNDVSTNDNDPESEPQTIASYNFDSDGDGDTETAGTVGTATQIGGTNTDGTYVANAGDLTLNDDGTYDFTPADGFAGNVIVTYTACDNASTAACEEATLVITVLDVKRDYGDAPVAYPIAWHRALTDTDENGALDGATDVWLGDETSFETSQSFSAAADGDNDDAMVFGAGTNEFPLIAEPSTTYPVDVVLNAATTGKLVHLGMWIDWNNDGTYDDFYTGSGTASSPVTVTINVTTPAATDAPTVNVRLRADDEPLLEADFTGGKTNGEVEDYQSVVQLPVELSRFEGKGIDCNETILNWTSQTEENFSHYELERSTDGARFEQIEQIEGTGGLTLSQTYKHTDNNDSARNYYRLKMVDLDGSVEYSDVVFVQTDCDDEHDMTVYPNPLAKGYGALNIRFYSEHTEEVFEIVDVLGTIVSRIELSVNEQWNTIRLDVSHLPSGRYFLRQARSARVSHFIIQE